MATVQLSNLMEVLQPAFGDRVHAYTNERVRFYNMLPIENRPFDGKHLQEAITASFPNSFAFLGPNATALPSPASLTVANTTITPAYCYATVGVDWDLLAQSSGAHAFAEAWTLTMERTIKDTLLRMERITCGNGAGVLNPLRIGTSGTVSTTGGIQSAAMTATIGDAISGVNAANWSFRVCVWDAVNLEVGTRVEFWLGTYSQASWRAATKRANPSSQDFYTIANNVPDVSGGFSTITIAEASSGSGGANTNPEYGDYIAIDEAIVQNGQSAGVNCGNEMIGLDGHIMGVVSGSTANPALTGALFLQPNTKAGFTAVDTHQGIPVATNGRWVSPSVKASGDNTQYLSTTHLEELSVSMNVFGSTEADQAGFIGAHPFQIRKYREPLYPQERYSVTNETPSLPTGAKSSMSEQKYIMFSDKPLIPGRFFRADRAYVVNTKDVRRYQLRPFSFKPVHQNFSNRPADEQNAMSIQQIGTPDRTSSGVIYDLKYT